VPDVLGRDETARGDLAAGEARPFVLSSLVGRGRREAYSGQRANAALGR
jgi:hypothetical protein